jgi:glycosyltransferase involved in cell wall biosynthesis
MFCTSIIPTVGRKTLQRAVQSVLSQDFSHDDFEVIVVNDSGAPLPFEEWQTSPSIRMINTNHRERCIARNAAAALAQGEYLHFLDDDDWLLPGALETFWKLAQNHKDAAWLYGGTVICDRQDQPVIHLIHNLNPNCFLQTMAGEWIPLQSSLIHHSRFHQVGGFNPLIPGIEDVDLARRMSLHFDFFGNGELVSGVELGAANSTTNQSQARLEGRGARELILNEAGVSERLWRSAHNGFWRGRTVRLFLTSAVWNLSHKRFFTAGSRLVYGMIVLLPSVMTSLFSRQFWSAIAGPYESEAFSRGQRERQKDLIGASE